MKFGTRCEGEFVLRFSLIRALWSVQFRINHLEFWKDSLDSGSRDHKILYIHRTTQCRKMRTSNVSIAELEPLIAVSYQPRIKRALGRSVNVTESKIPNFAISFEKIRDHNYINGYMKNRLNMGNVCQYSVQTSPILMRVIRLSRLSCFKSWSSG
jgi:hypothetical protein